MTTQNQNPNQPDKSRQQGDQDPNKKNPLQQEPNNPNKQRKPGEHDPQQGGFNDDRQRQSQNDQRGGQQGGHTPDKTQR